MQSIKIQSTKFFQPMLNNLLLDEQVNLHLYRQMDENQTEQINNISNNLFIYEELISNLMMSLNDHTHNVNSIFIGKIFIDEIIHRFNHQQLLQLMIQQDQFISLIINYVLQKLSMPQKCNWDISFSLFDKVEQICSAQMKLITPFMYLDIFQSIIPQNWFKKIVDLLKYMLTCPQMFRLAPSVIFSACIEWLGNNYNVPQLTNISEQFLSDTLQQTKMTNSIDSIMIQIFSTT